jgi:hypothetical protein
MGKIAEFQMNIEYSVIKAGIGSRALKPLNQFHLL